MLIEQKIQENYDLSQITAMKVGGPARYFCDITTLDEFKEIAQWADRENVELFMLGQGSNMIVNDAGINACVIRLHLKGIEIFESQDSTTVLDVASGEIWDDVVAYAVDNNLWGIENLSHIPGLMGAFAVQNVGAYGQEAANVIDSVFVYDMHDKTFKNIDHAECGFSYRTSIFNSSEKGRYIILQTRIRLHKNGTALLGYPDVQKYFKERNIDKPTLKEIRQAIISIRDRKLPLPSKVPNTGSFFKNLLITEEEYQNLYTNISDNFEKEIIEKLSELHDKFIRDGQIKIPTAFLIDICELKGVCVGGACINENQPLVILNESGSGTSDDVLRLFKKVRQTIYSKCGVEIVNEPELIGFTKSELQEYFEII